MREYLGEAKDLRNQMRVFCASLKDLDTQIGRLLRTLDELDLAGNTLVFASSDNGPEDCRISNAANAGVGRTGPQTQSVRGRHPICKIAGVPLPAPLQPDGEDANDIRMGDSRPRRKPLRWEWLFRVRGGDTPPPHAGDPGRRLEAARQPRRQPG
jgi:arylsulfatase A-like enzyme